MPEFDINSATTTNYSNVVKNVVVPQMSPDSSYAGKTSWTYPDAKQHLGYYQLIPQVHSALHVLGYRVCGLGYDTDNRTRVILENIRGVGNETFLSIINQMFIESKVFGDVFANVLYDDDGDILNIKRLFTGDMTVWYDENGLIWEYEQRVGGNTRKFKPEEILHISNKKISNENHGTSLVVSLKKIIDAKNQALDDEITIRHRDKALGIVYYQTDDAGKISYANSQIEQGVNKGEMIGLPEKTAIIQEFPNKNPSDRIAWLTYLDNLFYQQVGTPKVLVTSEGYTEAGGKAGLLAFEPTEIAEKLKLEEDLKSQLGLIIKFKRAPSLLGDAMMTEQKNAGQTGIQPNETMMSATRTE